MPKSKLVIHLRNTWPLGWSEVVYTYTYFLFFMYVYIYIRKLYDIIRARVLFVFRTCVSSPAGNIGRLDKNGRCVCVLHWKKEKKNRDWMNESFSGRLAKAHFVYTGVCVTLRLFNIYNNLVFTKVPYEFQYKLATINSLLSYVYSIFLPHALYIIPTSDFENSSSPWTIYLLQFNREREKIYTIYIYRQTECHIHI